MDVRCRLVENPPAGIIGGDRIHIAANRCPRRIHARDDGELRVCGEHHHHQHQNRLRNDVAVVRPRHDHNDKKDQSAEQAYPVQAHQRTPDDQSGGVNTLDAERAVVVD